MSGPMAASFGLEAGVLIAAQSILQGIAEIAAGASAAEQQAEATRRQRRAERHQMRAAQQAGGARQQRQAATQEALVRLTQLLDASPTGTSAVTARLQELGDAGVSLQAQLAAFLARARQAEATDAAAARRATVARALERLELDESLPLPLALESLAQQLVAAPTPDRAEALASELRLQVQSYNAARAAAAGQQELQEAAAVVLEQSLKDLGYEVGEIEETLFVEGGVAHFQRADWGDYFIRLRLDPQRKAMNFNVVRAGTPGEDRQREDMLAEERWCSEFPRLFETLKARGIPISVTRLLQAGEAPVQVVSADSLPIRAAAEHWHEPLKARGIA